MFSFPKRPINRALVYAGLFGIVFQLTAACYALWHGISLQAGWVITLIAPLLCIASGTVSALQLQKEQKQ
ncbi:hypothetical protein [Rheinheimera baltica]|uniref:Uncharacterized protein n=1 Tax=Rheinheimera baltica TaxID=67576 RepID=A0ABT9HUJ4_9GAMM|nr:hypothetical protein [Rheinheimera baltica]MDP5134490.1 hypothetical protein [Rheinheimera baltica]MDP5141315.1 hypothetical protein [Rheinheimera baltica]MDP5148544.1 hypothetical protein [Rheinheimera baltica]MDP5189160.1 hypothetical protein [Rheinheimera baltica]